MLMDNQLRNHTSISTVITQVVNVSYNKVTSRDKTIIVHTELQISGSLHLLIIGEKSEIN